MSDSIILYSSPNACGMCEMIKRELNNRNINFKIINNLDDLTAHNITAVPTLEVDGQRFVRKQILDYLKGENK